MGKAISRTIRTTLFLSLTLVAGLAFAQDKKDKEMAKKHFKAGLLLLEVENYSAAADEFQKSIGLYPTKTGYFNLASCHRELGRYSEAIETVNKLKVEFYKELDEKWQSEIVKFEESVTTQTLEIKLTVDVAGASIKVDGRDAGQAPLVQPLLLAPGEHKIEISHQDYQKLVHPLSVVSGEDDPKTISLKLVPKSEPVEPKWETQDNVHFVSKKEATPDGKRRIWTWVTYGVCGAAGISAVVTGALNLTWTGELEDECGGTNCKASLKDEVQTVQRLGTATNVLIGVSAATLILGTILLFAEGTDDSEDDEFALIPSASPHGAGLSVTKTF